MIQSLPGVAKSTKYVTLPNGFHDVSDYIASLPKESSAETIRELIEQTPYVDVESLGKAQSEQWQEPQSLPADMPPVPPFNFECLPDTLRPWIEDISERMQCPPDFPAVGAMIALGSLVGRKVGIRPKRHDDWLEIPNCGAALLRLLDCLKRQRCNRLLSLCVVSQLKRGNGTKNRIGNTTSATC